MFSQRSSLGCIQYTYTISSPYPGPVNVNMNAVDLDSRSLSCIPFYISEDRACLCIDVSCPFPLILYLYWVGTVHVCVYTCRLLH